MSAALAPIIPLAGQLAQSELYSQLWKKALSSHQQGRRADLFTQQDIDLARLYCYGYRTHTIGAFHATREALESREPRDPLARAHWLRAREHLEDLANLGMDMIPSDFRAVVSTFYRYHQAVQRATDAMMHASRASGDAVLGRIGERFTEVMEGISSSDGIYLTQDREAPEQASFVVPNLGITIVPLIYGDHHSWNLAHLTPEHLDVPNHRHHSGVEIHLGYRPLDGFMILGDCKSPVSEGYALPIPPMTRHGWVNTSGQVHHVPFIFGSMKQAGWGIFMDVEPQPIALARLETVERTHWKMNAAAYLEREIESMASSRLSGRSTIIHARVTDRDGSGGLELSVSCVDRSGMPYPIEDFRIGSVVRGTGRLQIGPAACVVQPHDHFGIPAGMSASLRPLSNEPLVVLDTLIKTV